MIAMIDSLIVELDKELTEAKTAEKLAQEECEGLTVDFGKWAASVSLRVV